MRNFQRRGKYAAHLRFAQRAWLPQERGAGPASPAWMTDSQWCGGQPPILGAWVLKPCWAGRTGVESGREKVPHPGLGGPGACGVRSGEGGSRQTLIKELPLLSLNGDPRTTRTQKGYLLISWTSWWIWLNPETKQRHSREVPQI
jgi:hypothetical protein